MMDLDDSDKVIIEEAIRSHKISVDSIESYDTKIHQIVILSAIILSAVFTIAGFFSVEYTIEKITSKIVFYFGYFVSIGLILFFLIISLILCLKTYTISQYYTIGPMNMWQGLSSYTQQSQKNNFMNDLMEEFDYNTNENLEISNTLWDNYTKALAYIAISIALIAVFIVFAILIKVGI